MARRAADAAEVDDPALDSADPPDCGLAPADDDTDDDDDTPDDDDTDDATAGELDCPGPLDGDGRADGVVIWPVSDADAGAGFVEVLLPVGVPLTELLQPEIISRADTTTATTAAGASRGE